MTARKPRSPLRFWTLGLGRRIGRREIQQGNGPPISLGTVAETRVLHQRAGDRHVGTSNVLFAPRASESLLRLGFGFGRSWRATLDGSAGCRRSEQDGWADHPSNLACCPQHPAPSGKHVAGVFGLSFKHGALPHRRQVIGRAQTAARTMRLSAKGEGEGEGEDELAVTLPLCSHCPKASQSHAPTGQA